MTSPGAAVFVTALHRRVPTLVTGGSGAVDADRRASLAAIARCGCPVVCFVARDTLGAHEEAFRATAPNIACRPLEDVAAPARLTLLRRVLDADPGVASAFWIDAGLADVRVISTRYTTAASLAVGRYHDVGRAFPSLLVDRLKAAAGSRVLALACTSGAIGPLHPSDDAGAVRGTGEVVVAALFGGSRASLARLGAAVDADHSGLTTDAEVGSDERVLTRALGEHPQLFHALRFDTWQHEGWPAYDPLRRSFSGIFDTLLQPPPSWPAPSLPSSVVARPTAPPTSRDDIFDQALHRLGLANYDVRFVQVGAMDGVSFDDFHGYVRMYGWAGLLVEPMPWHFERLRAAYACLDPDGTRYRFERAAIAEADGTLRMLAIDPAAVDDGRVAACFGGMSAIWPPRNGLASEGDAAVVAQWGRAIDVPSLSLATLLTRHDVRRIDVLCIDAEGWDFRILRQLDVSRWRPLVIRCEWVNLDADEQRQVLEWLHERDYVTCVSGQNLDAVARAMWAAIEGGAPIVVAGGGVPRSHALTLVCHVAPAGDSAAAIGAAVARDVEPWRRVGLPLVVFAEGPHVAGGRAALDVPDVVWVARDLGAMAAGLSNSGASGPDAEAARAAMLAPLLLHDAAIINPFATDACLWVPSPGAWPRGPRWAPPVAAWRSGLEADGRYHIVRVADGAAASGTGSHHVMGGTVAAIRAVNGRMYQALAAADRSDDAALRYRTLAESCPGLIAWQ